MKKNTKKYHLLTFFVILCLSAQGFAADSINPVTKALPKTPEGKPSNLSELENLENLISLTEQNLQELSKLKFQIEDYYKQQNLFLDHPNNKDLLIKTSKVAKQVLETIKEQNLTHLFDAKFLSELSLFAKMVKKPSLPKN